MPNDPSSPQSWKGEDRSALPGGRKSGSGSQYAWKPGASPAKPGAGGRKTKVVFLTFAGAVCLAGLVWLIYLLFPARPTCVAVVAGDFRPILEDLSLPLNIYGDRGGRDFLGWANSGIRAQNKWCSILGDRGKPWPVGTGRREDDWLRALADRKEDQVIIYLSQPGGADEQGNAFLFDETGARVDFAKLLQGLKAIKKRKLLLVDCTQTASDWQHGMLVNNFAAGLQKLNKEIEEDPNLLVLCASAPGQRSWVSEEFGQSIFTHYLLEGLSGSAAPGDRDAINASDLFEYVANHVPNWVQRNRADQQRPFTQTPILLPAKAETTDRAKKFLLAYRDRSATAVKAQKRQIKEADLQAAWRRCESLSSRVPAPWVYTPRLWHRYLGLLVRSEQLMRAGEEEAAGRVAASATALADRMDSARQVDATEALSTSLVMPAALGRDVTVDDVKLAELAERPIPQLEKITAELHALAPSADEAVPRNKYMSHLLTKLRQDTTSKRLDDVAARINLADDGGASRPAEAHLVVMLAAYKAPGWERPSPELIRFALETRQLADEALLSVDGTSLNGPHPYSERLPRRLVEEITLADRDRRRGEDLLFCAASFHPEAKNLLTSARKRYEQVRQIAGPLRRAVEVRDVTFAGLPGLTEWIAVTRTRDWETRVRRTEALWKELHALADRIEKLDPLSVSDAAAATDSGSLVDAPKDRPGDKDLLTQAEDIAREYEAQVKLYRDAVVPLSRSDATGQTLLQEMENALNAPAWFLSASERVNLLKRARDNSAKLAAGEQPPTPGDAVDEADIARYRARLARALLGTSILDAMADSNLGRAADLMDDNAPKLGAQLGGHWQKLITEADRKQREDTSKSTVPLPWRERIGLVAGTRGDLKSDASQDARNTRWADSFRRLAGRAELDQWYDEKQPPQPYSEKLAAKLLHGLSSEEAADQTAKLVGRRNRGLLHVEPPSERILTTEKDIALRFRVREMDASMEPGSATLMMKLDQPEVLKFKKSPQPHPASLARDVEEVVGLVAVRPLDTRTDTPDVNVALTAYYRGQIVPGAVAKLPVRPFPDLVVSRPQAKGGAQIAVRADEDLDMGALAIVFDCSGSMNDGTKFADAKAALRHFQDAIPPGTRVSLWAYGQYPGEKDWDKVGEKVKDIPSWDPKDPRQKDALYNGVKNLTANGYTPLLDTMIEALNDREFQNAPGFKTLIAITDGCDNKSTFNQKFPPEQHTASIRSRFQEEVVDKKRNVSIQMMLFQLKEEEKIADNQFPDAAFLALGRQSRKHKPENLAQLNEYLSMSMRPRVELYRKNQKLPFELLAKRPNEPLEWAPSPPLTDYGEYEAHVRGLEQKLYLDEGDRLALRLRRTDTGVRLVRQLMADETERSDIHPLDGTTPDASYVLGLVRNSIDASGERLRARFTLEDRAATRSNSGIVRVDRPRFVWWEMKAANTKDIPSRSRVTLLSAQPAPTWELASERWPTTSGNRMPPSVEVWASSSEPEAVDDRVISPGDAVFSQAVDGKAANLESAGFEPFAMPIDASGTGPTEECFIVRIYSPTGRRYIPSLGPDVKAEVHRYFFDAKRSTSAFLLPAEAKHRPLRLKLISVEDSKGKSTRLGRDFKE